nr:MAG TPA: DNA cytosine methyltransferase [Caudoviricetes sp.]
MTPVECERLQGFPSGWTDIGDWTDRKARNTNTLTAQDTRLWATP